jgi:hypothetical protein
MLALVPQIFLGKKHLVKDWLISTLGKVVYIGTSKEQFLGIYQTSLHFAK